MTSRVLFLTSFVFAVLLTVIPLPPWAVWCRPIWGPLILLYWVILFPESVGLGAAFFLGILLDLLQGAPLGKHALALLPMTYLAWLFARRIRLFPMLQQMLVVGGLLIFYQCILLWLQHLTSPNVAQSGYWLLSVSVSALLWPWLQGFLRNLRRR